MNIIIFGATGTLGRHLVSSALEEGHQVTAFARRAKALQLEHRHLRRYAGDVLDADTVSHAVAGHDAVIVALGAGARGGVRAAGTARVISAMEEQGIRRLVALSTLGAGDSRMHLDFFWKHIMFGMLLRRAMKDHKEQEALIRASNTDWTIVRPAAFTDEPEVGTYHHGRLAGQHLRLKLPRADIARFMVGELGSERYLHQAPGLSC